MAVDHVMWNGKYVGSFDTNTKTYSKICDYDKSQIMKHPKYAQAVGISKGLIRDLIKKYGEIKMFNWQILNLPGEDTFEAIISFSSFIELKKEYYFGRNRVDVKNADPQLLCSLNHWVRRYVGQKILIK